MHSILEKLSVMQSAWEVFGGSMVIWDSLRRFSMRSSASHLQEACWRARSIDPFPSLARLTPQTACTLLKPMLTKHCMLYRFFSEERSETKPLPSAWSAASGRALGSCESFLGSCKDKAMACSKFSSSSSTSDVATTWFPSTSFSFLSCSWFFWGCIDRAIASFSISSSSVLVCCVVPVVASAADNANASSSIWDRTSSSSRRASKRDSSLSASKVSVSTFLVVTVSSGLSCLGHSWKLHGWSLTFGPLLRHLRHSYQSVGCFTK